LFFWFISFVQAGRLNSRRPIGGETNLFNVVGGGCSGRPFIFF